MKPDKLHQRPWLATVQLAGTMYARYVPPAKTPKAPTAVQSVAHSAAPSTLPASGGPAEGFSYSRYIPSIKVEKKPAPAPAASGSVHFFDDDSSSPSSKRKRDGAGDSHDADNKRAKTSANLNGNEAPSGAHDGEKKKKKNRRKRKQRTLAVDDSSDESADESKAPAKTANDQEEDDAPPEPLPGPLPEPRESPAPSVGQDVAMDDAEEDKLIRNEPKEEEGKKKRNKEKKKKSDVEEDGEKDQSRHKMVLERKTKSLQLADQLPQEPDKESDEEPEEQFGLEPLPQPVNVDDDETTKPTYEALPSWLAAPIRVSHETRAPFTDLGILPKASRVMAEKGYKEAFAVQTAAIPLLVPTSKQRPGDVLVSAATGSGKTLAYALPMVRDISSGVVTRLRALVVLPTRELVRQAQQVFETCAKAYEGGDRKSVRIGIAVGNQSLKAEQVAFVESESRYDPEEYTRILAEAKKQQSLKPISADIDDLLESEGKDARLGPWEGDVIDFTSKVDVLICTPGRLVEHMEQTVGFSLDYVRWLVVDEADKLLAQSFQGWLDLVLDKFKVNDKFGSRAFPDMNYDGRVRKVILSATLTRDLSLLNQLSLRRPQLIVLEGDDAGTQIAEHTLPTTLRESAIRVHETNLKPLYLLDLLRSNDMKASPGADGGSDSSDTSDSEGETPVTKSSELPMCLVFTKSNEAALRLTRLLTLLDASLADHVSTLTSTTPTHLRRKTLREFGTASSPVRLIIASDLVARGIDIPNLPHVINYDLPASVAGYVHRVGRTARAGRPGQAWTLVSDDESGWFWGKIAKGQGMRRAQKVDRTRIEEMGEERVQEYETALAALGKEALELRRKK